MLVLSRQAGSVVRSQANGFFLCSGLCFLLCFDLHGVTPAELVTSWDTVFRTRNSGAWGAVWHSERHRRCYHELLIHMDWVCEKDIYKVRRKKRNFEFGLEEIDTKVSDVAGPFRDKILTPPQANALFRRTFSHHFKKAHVGTDGIKRGITEECCYASIGCTWEEYAEYCPANKRIRT